MRSIVCILAVFVASGPAVAQSWQEYLSTAFALAFPAAPQIETDLPGQRPRGASAVYSVRRDQFHFQYDRRRPHGAPTLSKRPPSIMPSRRSPPAVR